MSRIPKLSRSGPMLPFADTDREGEGVISVLPGTTRFRASQKRLFAPTWWVEGLTVGSGHRDAWPQWLGNQILKGNPETSRTLLAPESGIPAGLSIPIFTVWHEIVARACMGRTSGENVRIHLNRFLSGTQADLLDQARSLEAYWNQPLTVWDLSPSTRGQKGFRLKRAGTTRLVQHAQLKVEPGNTGLYLSLNFTQPLQKFSYEHGFTPHHDQQFLTSINPTVIQAMGRKLCLKRVLNYFCFEVSKSYASFEEGWCKLMLEPQDFFRLHKDLTTLAPLLYDHGLLNWNASVPPPPTVWSNPSDTQLVCCAYPVSEPLREAGDVEKLLSQKIFARGKDVVVEEIPASAPVALVPSPIPSALPQPLPVVAPVVLPSAESQISAPQPVAPAASADSEFMILISEFYESLKPLQKRAFEKERKSMSPEQFRSYMMPILKRRKKVKP